MIEFNVSNINEYLDVIWNIMNQVADPEDPVEVVFRGQQQDWPLLPSIARSDNKIDTTKKEELMLQEFQRKTKGLFQLEHLKDDGNWLVYAQHFGMKTRLLDWTRNPLNALWFSLDDIRRYSFVYAFYETENNITYESAKPFDNKYRIRLLKPSLNNARIIAQDGWFTIHPYSTKNNMFVPLEDQKSKLKEQLVKIKVRPKLKKEAFRILDTIGINYFTIYPDIHGVSNQINWEFRDK